MARISSTDANLVTPSSTMDWDALRKPGCNGIILVMLSLTWWGKVSSANEEWRLAVTDVTAALCCLCESCTPTNPRKRKPAALGSSGINLNTALSSRQHKRAKVSVEVTAGQSSRQLRKRGNQQ